MIKKVEHFIRERDLIGPDQVVIVAVSGGMDSMVLLHLLHALGHICVAAHVDHGLRGQESDDDREFVEDHCRRQGITCKTTQVDVQREVAIGEASVQMAARKLRYAWFDELLEKGVGEVVATAHHADDNVETILMDLMRGTGLLVRAGIPASRGRFVRPLLHCSREEIEAFADEQHIPFRNDSSNKDPKYLRNRTRHELIPLMEQLVPGAMRDLRRHAKYLGEAATVVREKLKAELDAALIEQDDNELMCISALRRSRQRSSLLLKWLAPHGFHPEQIEKIMCATDEEHVGARFHAEDHRLTVDRDHLILERNSTGRPDHWSIDDDLTLPPAAPFQLGPVQPNEVDLDTGGHVAWLDRDLLQFPLELRIWRPGDRMKPWGMAGTKLISDMLIDAKVSRPEKERTYVLTAADKIVWLVGHRIAEGFGVGDHTTQVLRVEHLM